MKRPRGPGGRFLKKDELAEYYRQHPELDPRNHPGHDSDHSHNNRNNGELDDHHRSRPRVDQAGLEDIAV